MKLIILFLCFISFNAMCKDIKEIKVNRDVKGSYVTFQQKRIDVDEMIGVAYSDNRLHKINDKEYFLIIQGHMSHPASPESYCGTGMEMVGDIYQWQEQRADRVFRFTVSSCDLSIYQHSQFFADKRAMENFSSINWDKTGLRVNWFGKNFNNLKAKIYLNKNAPELAFIH